MSFSSVGGITEVDMWRVTAQLSGDQNPISTNLERVDTNSFTKKGTGMSQTSGNFSFPSTGLYLVTFNTSFTKNGDARNCNTTILVTTDNFAYNTTSYSTDFIQQTESNFTAISGTTTAIINVTSTTNVKCRFAVTFSQTTLTQGSTNENVTYMTFIRLGDSV